MLSFLSLGFLIGLQHALEPDHVAAVASMSTRGGTLRDQAARGAFWGLGHALTLLLLAGSSVLFGFVIPEVAGRYLEGAVGVMLFVLGISVFVRLKKSGIHIHAHTHGHRGIHYHAHSHAPGTDHSRDPHTHAHERPSLRSLAVGAVHGLAGSSALVLLVGSAAQTPALGLAYIAVFGVGAIVGMMLLAGILSLPLRFSAERRTRLYQFLCAGAGMVSITLGTHLVWGMTIPGPNGS